jgi:sporulation protein YlmC with PRC-barrel domain
MRMTWEQLKNLPVLTLAGVKLGHVTGLILDPETHDIIQYEIKQGTTFNRRTLLISKTQVISVNIKQMVVEDLTGATKADADAKTSPVTNPTVTTLASSRED